MDRKKTCLCCEIIEKEVRKNSDVSHHLKCISVNVKLTRIDEDPELLSWIANNLKVDVDLKNLKNNVLNCKPKNAIKKPVAIVTRSAKRNCGSNEKNKKLAIKTATSQRLTERLQQRRVLLLKSRLKPSVKKNSNKMSSIKTGSRLRSNTLKKKSEKIGLDVKKGTSKPIKRASDSKEDVNSKRVKQLRKSPANKNKPFIDNASKILANGYGAAVKNMAFDFIDETLTSRSVAQNAKNDLDSIKSEVSRLTKPSTSGSIKKNSSQSKRINILRRNSKSKNSSPTKNPVDSSIPANLSVEESVSLISQLTGCKIHPSKVKVFSLPSTDITPPEIMELERSQMESITSCVEEPVACVNEPVNSVTEPVKSVREPFKCAKERAECKSLSLDCHGISEQNDISVGCSSVTNGKTDLSNLSEVRTVYDLINEMSATMPSWNLHILPDTNTFCIGQVTRNRLGIPHLSKCIELDDNFNAKVYIYQQHCKKFDGVYDSEDSVAALIHEIDHAY